MIVSFSLIHHTRHLLNSMINSKFLTLNCLVRTYLTVLMLDARVLAMEPLLVMLMILLHLLMLMNSMLSLLVHIKKNMLKTADIVIIIILLQMLGLHLLISNQVLEGNPQTLSFHVLTMTTLSTKLTSLMKAPFFDHCHKLEKTQASMSNNNYCKLAKNSSSATRLMEPDHFRRSQTKANLDAHSSSACMQIKMLRSMEE